MAVITEKTSMITSFLIGAFLGGLYAWSAHTQHHALIAAGTVGSRPLLILTNIFRIALMTAAIAVIAYLVGPSIQLLYGVIAGYVATIIFLCRR